MPPRSSRRLLPAFAIAGLLLLPPLQTTVRALPLSGPDGPAAARWEVGDLFSWLGQTFASLRAEDGESPVPVNPDPLDGGPEGDTGKLIDPDG
ncbi:MAG TPA: hypothetical protein VL025_10675 [Thermoanaerobaculia bacterium]|nr:hypothetical protein [Thermoanaerobaculia bacterium]